MGLPMSLRPARKGPPDPRPLRRWKGGRGRDFLAHLVEQRLQAERLPAGRRSGRSRLASPSLRASSIFLRCRPGGGLRPSREHQLVATFQDECLAIQDLSALAHGQVVDPGREVERQRLVLATPDGDGLAADADLHPLRADVEDQRPPPCRGLAASRRAMNCSSSSTSPRPASDPEPAIRSRSRWSVVNCLLVIDSAPRLMASPCKRMHRPDG